MAPKAPGGLRYLPVKSDTLLVIDCCSRRQAPLTITYGWNATAFLISSPTIVVDIAVSMDWNRFSCISCLSHWVTWSFFSVLYFINLPDWRWFCWIITLKWTFLSVLTFILNQNSLTFGVCPTVIFWRIWNCPEWNSSAILALLQLLLWLISYF